MRFIYLFMCLFGLAYASSDGLEGKESTVPVVDLQDYFNPETKDQFIDEVREALHKVGFFGVRNTGVDSEIIDNLYDSLETFFAFDRETKLKVSAEFFLAQRGYVAFGNEAAKGCSESDLKEYYMIGRSLSDEEHEKYLPLKNQWPDFMDFETPAVNFFNQLEDYSVLFQEIFSLALNQDKDFLNKICKYGDTSCRMIHYPQQGATEGVTWAGAHTDIDLFTILPKATADGLEVQIESGEWIPVRVKGDAMVVNGGDFLEAFSNGYFKSSKHRVLKPKKMDSDRYSCVHFVHPRSEAHLFPLNEWIEQTGGVAKYIDATRWELLMERLADLNLASDVMLKELSETQVLERLMTVGRASPDAMRAVHDAGYASDAVKEKVGSMQSDD